MKKAFFLSLLLCVSCWPVLAQIETPIDTTTSPAPAKPVAKPAKSVAKEEKPAVAVKPLTAIDSLLTSEVELNRISETRADERIKLLQEFIKKESNESLKVPAQETLMRAHAALAENQLKQQHIEQAVVEFQKAFAAAPNPITDRAFSIIWAFPNSMSSYGYREEAIAFMRKIEPSFNDQVARLAQISIFYFNSEAGDDAARVLERAIALTPASSQNANAQNAKYYYSLANARIMQLRLRDAAPVFQKAIKLDEKHPYAFAGLAALLRGDGEVEDAISLYKHQLEVVPEHETAHGGLGIAYLLAGNDEEASKELTKQFALTPRDFQLFTQLAYIAISRQDFMRAGKWAELALGVAPNYSWARITMANVLIARGEFLGAEELLSDALARGNKFFTLNMEISKALLLGENYDGAYEQCEKLFTLTPEGEFEIGGVKNRNLKPLIENDHKAALSLPMSISTDEQFRLLEGFFRFKYYLAKINAEKAEITGEATTTNRRQRVEIQVKALDSLSQMLQVNDTRQPFRKLWAAEELLSAGVALERAADLCLEAVKVTDNATLPEGAIRDIPQLDRVARAKLYRARAYHLLGRIKLKQNQNEDAIKYLEAAVQGIDDGAEQRVTISHLATAVQSVGRDDEALALYIKSYNRYDSNATVQKALIENLYRKIHGSLEGLELK